MTNTPSFDFASIINACKMGDILCNTKAQKNAWKLKMIKAGLGEAANFPDNWDQLSEDEKEKRLTGALDALKQ